MATEILQYVEAGRTKEGQAVKFIGKKARWIVSGKSDQWVILSRGQQTKRVDHTYQLFQEPFSNI